MTPCSEEMQLLVQADIDGALSPAEAARVAAHLAHCSACTALQTEMLTLSAAIQDAAPRYAAPAALRAAVRARIAAMAEPTGTEPARAVRPAPWRTSRLAPFGAGFALAAMLALAIGLPRPHSSDPGLDAPALLNALVSGHIRALQPGHLMDVVSTDQHTVKPWFDGRLDFAPPVKDLRADGFPLTGGRVDYLAGHAAAALVYQRRQHIIDLFVWPQGDPGAAAGSRQGYTVRQWARDGMRFAVVSDLDPRELDEFVQIWTTR